ncbi:sulfatase-like hydrolase/transferase [Blastopirellula sp. JC732]|uniref:Sulfatase-like hydrolase/transferase n=1 Tax=Blastopirellula sediminis TaxID=2894196 RepID=A0A9X1MK89_9BACT|nr:sulfatase-like hydrolase/transferase [Blastopirellula sediminis]MCC9609157.1 sulfatase-like hydrolase/transferase [Blastopirellula sediminis]MCC9628066.1 sulfatase-like hydrolase/transferase [Blastopirellula sediminis]
MFIRRSPLAFCIAWSAIAWGNLAVAEPVAPSRIATGFEEFAAGELRSTDDTSGNWTAEPNQAVVHTAHHRSGKQSLRLLGGEKRSVTWTPPKTSAKVDRLEFWFERWTQRAPFDFLVEASDGQKWTTLYHDRGTAKIGSFQNRLSLPLPNGLPQKIRFTSTTPDESGVMIDDLSVEIATPQRIVSVTARQPVVPVLVNSQLNPVLDICVTVEGSLQPLRLSQLDLKLAGSLPLDQIARLDLFATGNLDAPNWRSLRLDSKELQSFGSVSKLSSQLQFDGDYELSPGPNHFFVSIELKETADSAKTIDVQASSAKIAGKSYAIEAVATPRAQRIGYALRKGGDDGVHTCRIPGLATSKQGTLIAVYDVRHRSGGDLPGDIDVGMSRSTDGGRTWEPMQIIFDMGSDPKWRYDGVGDPAVLVDPATGDIWVAALWSHGDRAWHRSGQGLSPEETGQLMLVRSSDDGRTWSAPINITAQVKRPEWSLLLQGPGKGIAMQDGTLVFAAQYQDPPEQQRLPHSTIIYSKDHGKTWHAGAGAFDDTTEAQVVEVEPGVLMLNCRYNRESTRVVMTTTDMGKTWKEHPTSRRSLIEPTACMASLINVNRELVHEQPGWLLFSNPDSLSGRQRIMIKGSPDGGKSWPQENRLLLDEGSGAGYSCMTMIDSETIGIIYEGSGSHLQFQRVPLVDVIGAEQPKPTAKKPVGLSLPQVFGDHMVLQADLPLPIWGTAPVGASVDVRLGDERQSTVASRTGRWQVTFPVREASRTPVELEVESEGSRVTISDILIGEVWYCAGQSNMAWPLRSTNHGAEEIAAANRPLIRLLNLQGGAPGVPRVNNAEHLSHLLPENYCVGQWETASPESASEFSAVGWYFGRKLEETLNVPIGLINVGQGGSPTEAWMRRELLESTPELQGLVAGDWLRNPLLGDFCKMRGVENLLPNIQAGAQVPSDDLGPNHPFKPGFLWDAAVAPVIPLAIRGVLWYQGESNAETAERVVQHNTLLPAMIADWRKQWGRADLPFLQVQLPAIERPEWPAFRDGQRRMLDQLENVGMAITIDTGERTNVHPHAKQVVGDRLAYWALANVYQQPQAADDCGPLFCNCEAKGNQFRLTFDHVNSGLVSSDGKPLRHFELAGADGNFHSAIAKIIGASVILTSPEVPAPQMARYAWSPFPQPSVNFFNGAGLPASPFTTAATINERTTAKKRPNILVIISEDNGQELGCYGDPYAQTPNLNRLAARGCRFENAYVTHPICSSSRASYLTGLFPFQNGQIGLATHRYAMFRAWDNIPSVLRQNGYRTGIIGKLHVNPESAFPFDYKAITGNGFGDRPVAQYVEAAAKFINDSDQPFFLTVNFPDAHFPLLRQQYGLPKQPLSADDVKTLPFIGVDNTRIREGVANYYNCIMRLDAGIGMLLDELNKSSKAEDTMIIYFGDHGAQFSRGKATCYEGGLRIPLIVQWPGHLPSGVVRDELISTVDILPTILDAAGLPPSETLPGKSLLPLARNENIAWRDFLFAERTAYSADSFFPQRTLRDRQFKLILNLTPDRTNPVADAYANHANSFFVYGTTEAEIAAAEPPVRQAYETWRSPPEVELYDLKADPWEFTNLANDPKYEPVRQKLLAQLQTFRLQHDDPLLSPAALKRLAEEHDRVVQKRKNGKYAVGESWEYQNYLQLPPR